MGFLLPAIRMKLWVADFYGFAGCSCLLQLFQTLEGIMCSNALKMFAEVGFC